MAATKTIEFPVQGMDCAECALHVQHAIEKVPGVTSANVLLGAEKAIVRLDANLVDMPTLRQAVEGAGYQVPAQDALPAAAIPANFTRRVLTFFALLFGAVLIAVMIAALVAFDVTRRRRKVQAAFANRPVLTDQQFFETYFLSRDVPAQVCSGVRRVLQEQLGADMSRLSAEDDFTKNLKFFFDFDSMVNVEIVLGLEREFGIKLSDEEAQKMHTVKEIVLGVAARLPANEA